MTAVGDERLTLLHFRQEYTTEPYDLVLRRLPVDQPEQSVSRVVAAGFDPAENDTEYMWTWGIWAIAPAGPGRWLVVYQAPDASHSVRGRLVYEP
jgi:hypothetical protein